MLICVSNLTKTFKTYLAEASTQSIPVVYNSCSTDHPLSCQKRRRDNPKMAGTSVQGMAKTQLEIVEVEKASLFTHRYILHFSLTVEFPRLI